eukprot:COSAG03_NODE_544_length_7025_cov_8.435894_5_plen_151_part_00
MHAIVPGAHTCGYYIYMRQVSTPRVDGLGGRFQPQQLRRNATSEAPAPPIEHYSNVLAEVDPRPHSPAVVETRSLLDCEDNGAPVAVSGERLLELEVPRPFTRKSRLSPRGEQLVSTRRQVAVLCGLCGMVFIMMVLRAASMRTMPLAGG